MSYKPDENDWMAYLYGELDGEAKERFEKYLLENDDARATLQKYHGLRKVMSHLEDEEVIAPPIVFSDTKPSFFGQVPYLKTIMSIAASLLIIILVGKMTGANVSVTDNEFRIGFGEKKSKETTPAEIIQEPLLTEADVRQMINESLENNNEAIQASWKENEKKLTGSIKQNLALNSNKVDALIRQASTASQEQISQFVSGMQAENMKQVKDYFALTSAEQKTYIENLLVDFADYLQQQRNNDLQLVQMKMNSLEKDTDIFKQETEQILTSIISTVGSSSNNEIKN
ncbi:MAG TPA: hypothetical protein VD927_12790 [Chryseosolibacter sp.]|nr:hypothetical protein [Chryseosolibacter sp.]